MDRFSVIVNDPPWRYSFSNSKSRRVENQYATMKLEDILAIKIPAADNCVMYLWVPAPKVPWAVKCFERWGFEWKTHGVWDKVRLGRGYWFRGKHEDICVGVKGKFRPPAPSLRIPSLVASPRGKHSAKPDWLQDHIDAAYPAASKLEMFARRERPGWTCWGDALGSIITPLGVVTTRSPLGPAAAV